MTVPEKLFTETALRFAQDSDRKHVVSQALSSYAQAFESGKIQFSNLPLARERASYTKWKSVDNLDKYLAEFEFNFSKRGGKVVWTLNAEHALNEILGICSRFPSSKILKSKTVTSEEIGLKEKLLSKNFKVTETDFGEFVQDLLKERPFHPVTPAMHKSAHEIADAFFQKFGVETSDNPAKLVDFVRSLIRKDLSEADIAISGENFLISDPGAICITENEGNFLLGSAFAKVHIAIAGIEKILPSLQDLELFLPLLATHGTGQKLTAYNSLLFGPGNEEEEGPDELYLILIDNNRSDILADTVQRKALNCIRCGACSNVCPIFQTAGGFSYGTSFGGPIGSLTAPFLQGKEYNHLIYATSNCGACSERCPVNIDIHKLFVSQRNQIAEVEKSSSKSERWAFFFWKKLMLSRSKLNKKRKLKSFILKKYFKSAWGESRTFPEIAEKSFNQIWREENLS